MTTNLLKSICLYASLVLVAAAGQGQSTNQLHFPQAGFTIAPLEAPPGQLPQQALIMFLPATDGFAPNVNVQIQAYEGTMDDYVALSLDQFKTTGLKVLQQKNPGKSVAVLEYSGKSQGRQLHWYAKAEKSAGKVYLVTGTATEEQWSKAADRLKACVDSFRCDRDERSIAPNVDAPRR